jgi:hypothetical protein
LFGLQIRLSLGLLARGLNLGGNALGILIFKDGDGWFRRSCGRWFWRRLAESEETLEETGLFLVAHTALGWLKVIAEL